MWRAVFILSNAPFGSHEPNRHKQKKIGNLTIAKAFDVEPKDFELLDTHYNLVITWFFFYFLVNNILHKAKNEL